MLCGETFGSDSTMSSSGVVCESIKSAVGDGSFGSIPSACSTDSDAAADGEVPPLA